MHLLSALCSGFAGAANGTAEIYIRGSSTRATWYPDFEASSSNSSGADIALDAYGSAEVYVNQLVDVKVKDADGVLVRQYTDGYASPNIEVISPAFTGNDYVTAAAAVSEPTTLQAVLDLWETNAGAPDWKVSIGGTDTTLLNAFGSLTGLVFNVKSPAYGAVGDGVTNDQSAIAAALAAAVAAGGGIVFFPKGTYLISTAIEWDHRVGMLGVGGSLSVITTNSAVNAKLITFTSGSALNTPVSVVGMGFASTQSNTGDQVYASVAVNLYFDRCWFGATSTSTGIHVNLTATVSRITAQHCKFTVNSGTASSLVWPGVDFQNTTFARLVGCSFITSGTAYAGSLVQARGKTTIVGCEFNIGSVTAAGTKYAIETFTDADKLLASGNQFFTLGQTFTSFFKFGAASTVTALNNEVDANQSPLYTTGGLANGSFLQFYGRARIASSATPTIPDGAALVEMDSITTVPTWTMPTGFFPGQPLTVMVRNNSGAGWGAMTFTGASLSVTSTALTAGSVAVIRFIWSDLLVAGTYVWRSVFSNG